VITPETKERILEACRIEEVVGDFVSLKKRGANLLGVCPFHNERTPSFTVSPAKGFFKCFGCGKAGDSVTFMMEHEQLSFPEALRYLAGKYSITIEEEAPSAEMMEAQSQRESLFAMMDFAKNFYVDYLWNNDEGIAIGLSYFRERGFTDDIIRKFELGFSPDKWDGLTSSATGAGYKEEILEKAGLLIVNEQKKYDRFRGRVMFPVASLTGRTIAFGARILKTDPKSPKYLNSPETEIYFKSKSLYGISHAKKSVVEKDICYLVEGYTDVISLHQAGIENVVASSGTSLTVEQIRLIGRYTKNITVLYDGDAAGIKASLRGINLILEEGMNVRVVLFPDGEDPDSYSRKVSTVELLDYLTVSAVDFISFKTKLLLSDTAGDPIKKAGLVRDIVETIAVVPDAISRAAYLRQASTLMEMGEAVLIAEMNKIIRARNNRQGEETSASVQDHAGEMLDNIEKEYTEEQLINDEHSTEVHEEEIIRILLNYAEEIFPLPDFNKYLEVEPVKGKQKKKGLGREEEEEEKPELQHIKVKDFIFDVLQTDGISFTNEGYAGLLAEFANLITTEADYDAQSFINNLNPDLKPLAISLVTPKYELADWKSKGIIVRLDKDRIDKTVVDAMVYIQKKMANKKAMEFQNEIKERSEVGADIDELLAHYQELINLKMALNRITNTVINK
jgi:DNA primase